MKRIIHLRWAIAAVIFFIMVILLLFSYQRSQTPATETGQAREQKTIDRHAHLL
ncbi:MAG: hypothetical protein R6T99_03190 [Bacteroidales bacterium]